ncbi:uncharacterized protein LOC122645364 [Telopea speciosissima]|uniref:uncharacterized protein LOC122645364 n=1 Tax=Telopea speciosissima TaxID=54955 RepID=UPI001CC45A4E|nr:uncharacterized protein LOC122645364 [Telopea speciosissima]
MEFNQEKLKKLWDNWELEISILLSLLLQIILILTANFRKRMSSKWVVAYFVLWMAYLAADSVATFSLGIISSTLNDPSPWYNPDMLAFWTPFLLLHLGGPDTITAFSLQDSQLWLRHLLGLIFQIIATAYIFKRSLKTHSKLFLPTIFVLAAGIVKYGERTWSLKQASTDDLRISLIKKRDPGPDYAAVMEEFSSDLRAGNPGMLTVRRENQSQPEYYVIMEGLLNSDSSIDPMEQNPEEVLYGAYHFFQTFKRLFVDLILTFQDRNYSRSIFCKCPSSQAYKMIETELSYAYDMLYTKALVAHTPLGRIFRGISCCSILIAFCLFFSTVKQYDFKKKDIVVSYVLLIGALALEFVTIGMLIFSDWTVVILRKTNSPSSKWLEKRVYQILSTFRRLSQHHHRWSNQMGQYGLLSYIIVDHHQKPLIKQYLENFLDVLGLKEMWDEFNYIKYKTVSEELKHLIFKNLKDKSENIKEQDKRLNTRQGQWALKLPAEDCSLLQWSLDAEFDESLVMWHLATDICYKLQENINSAKQDPEDENKRMFSDQCLASRDISRYLLYLLLSRPSTMSSIAGLAVIRHGDTCEEAKKFFEEERVVAGDEFDAIDSLMTVHMYVRAEEVKGDKSKSILWDAVKLAGELQELPEDKRWETASNVWIEMLSYAARHCSGNYHAQTLSAGGELLTFLWLLEAHLGMGGHYQIKSGEFTTSYTAER